MSRPEEGQHEEGNGMTVMKDAVREAQLVSLRKKHPVGKRMENDLLVFCRDMERRFPQPLHRRNKRPCWNLQSIRKGPYRRAAELLLLD